MSTTRPTGSDAPTCVGLVPARGGSKRIPGKNIRPLGGHPLIAYTLAAAKESGVFADIIVSTDSREIEGIAKRYGGEVPFLRPEKFAGDVSPDIEWVQFTLRELAKAGRSYDAFSILRPTSPFRSAETIRRAWKQFAADKGADSLRAVELCKQHPAKMWIVDGSRMKPVMPGAEGNAPWHSTPYQALPRVFAQNASLEMAWCRVALEGGSIAGTAIAPFVTQGFDGFDVNNPHDWVVAEHAIAEDPKLLPTVKP